MDQQMSYFLPPITNTLPTGNCTLREVYRWITEDKSLETVTNELRAFIREGRIAEYRQLKQRQLPFVTPHGIFSRRKSDALISASGLVVVDIDHLRLSRGGGTTPGPPLRGPLSRDPTRLCQPRRTWSETFHPRRRDRSMGHELHTAPVYRHLQG